MTLPTAVEWGRFEQALLRAGRADMAPRDALHKSAAALGVSLPVIGLAAVEMQATVTTGALTTTDAATALASSTPAGAAAMATGAAGAAAMASQPIATASLAFVAKHVGAGVLAGALFAGGAHEASKVFNAPTSDRADAPVLAQRPDAHGAPAQRSVPGRQAAASHTELGSSAVTSSSQPATAASAPIVSAGAPAAAERKLDAATAGADDAIAQRVETNTPAANVAAFPTDPSAQSDPNAELEAMPEPVGLDLERRLLGRARRALAHGRPLVALRHLGLYSAKCPGGQLLAEANLLRVKALLRAGQRDKALWVARQEIERNSTRATVERVREMFQAQTEVADERADAGVPRQGGEKK